MRKLILALGLLFISQLLLSTTNQKTGSAEVSGKVINAQTGKPVENVYLYITEGEEEAISNSRGTFRITTWRKLPVTLTIQHPGYEKQQIRITSLPAAVEVRINKK